jgi:uncharacterized protein
MYRKPVAQLMGPSNKDVLPALGQMFQSISWEDGAGKKTDKATLTLLGPPSRETLPARDAQYTLLAGWSDVGPILQGVYKVQNWAPRGSPDEGDLIEVTLKAADFVDNLKQHGHKHYDKGKTFGQIVQSEAQDAGLSASVDPALANIVMDYQLKWSRSPIDFLHELCELVGGSLKLGGGKILVMKRGSGTSAGGQALSTINVIKTKGYGYNCILEPRTQHGAIAAHHIDKNGQRQLEQVQTGMEGPVYVLPHPYKSQTEAQNAAKSEAYERGNNTFSGTFESPGLPTARGEAPVMLSGYGWPIDGPCKAEHVRSQIGSDGSYMTTVEVKSGNQDKGKGK